MRTTGQATFAGLTAPLVICALLQPLCGCGGGDTKPEGPPIDAAPKADTGANDRTPDATPPGELTLSDGPAFDFGARPLGSRTDKSFTVQNVGAGPALGIAARPALPLPFRFKGGAYPGTGGTCGSTLAPGASCALVVTFEAATEPMVTATLSLVYGSARMVSVDLTGTGVKPALLTISDGPTFDFGPQAVGAAPEKTVTVSNVGGFPAMGLVAVPLPAPYAFKGEAYPGQNGTCGAALDAGATCTIVITFSPTIPGPKTTMLALSYADGALVRGAALALAGRGVLPALLAFPTGNRHDFGKQPAGSTTEYVVTIINQGGSAATMITPGALPLPFAFKDGAYPGKGGTCGATLALGGSCTVVLLFAPTTAGASLATLTFDYKNDGVARAASLDLAGSAAMAALLVVSDEQGFAFGDAALTGSLTHLFVVANAGGFPVSNLRPGPLVAPFTYRGGAFPGTGGTCGATIPIATTCLVVVTFSPRTSGAFQGDMTLAYDDTVNPDKMVTRALSGGGTTSGFLSVSDRPARHYTQFGAPGDAAAYDFGTVGLGRSTRHTFAVTNTGTGPVTAIAPAGPADPFGFAAGAFPGDTGTCGASLAAGDSCTVVVGFSPAAAGKTAGALALRYNDGSATRTVTRPLKGTGTPGAQLVIDDYPGTPVAGAWTFGQTGVGARTVHNFRVTNTGALTATGLIATTAGSAFGFPGGAAPGIGGSCTGSLAAQDSCVLAVSFTPSAPGLAAGALNLAYGSGTGTTNATASLALVGAGILQALVDIWDAPDEPGGVSFDFGTRGTSTTTEHTFTLVNRGAATAITITPGAMAAPFAFKGGAFPGRGSCTASLAAQATCTFTVTLTPGAATTGSDALRFDYRDGSGLLQTVRRPLSATGTTLPVLVIHDGRAPTGRDDIEDLHDDAYDFGYDFGSAGTAADHTFFVTNVGGQTALGMTGVGPASPFSFKGGAYPGAGGTCGISLAVGNVCTLVVSYSGAASGASRFGVSQELDLGASTVVTTRAVLGISSDRALLLINDCAGCALNTATPYDFGAAGIPTSHAFTLANRGRRAATAIAPAGALGTDYAFPGGAYPGTGASCSVTLAPGATCTIIVTLTPRGTGPRPGLLALAYADTVGSGAGATRTLTGTATDGAVVTVRNWPAVGAPFDPVFDFGSAGIPVDHTFTLSNGGARSATALGDGGGLTNGFGYKGGNYPGQGGTCTTLLPAGASCTVVLAFSPLGTGQRSGAVSFTYNDGSATRRATHALTATATTRASLVIWDGTTPTSCGEDCGPRDFGPVTVATTAEFTFTVVNTGAIPTTSIANPTAPDPPFAWKGGTFPGDGGSCISAVLAPAATCTIIVTFTPTAPGAVIDTLLLDYEDAGGTEVTRARRSLRGTGE